MGEEELQSPPPEETPPGTAPPFVHVPDPEPETEGEEGTEPDVTESSDS